MTWVILAAFFLMTPSLHLNSTCKGATHMRTGAGAGPREQGGRGSAAAIERCRARAGGV